MRILLAFDKFKDSMSAAEAGQRTEAGLRQVFPEADIRHAPLTDGGEGFAEILTTARHGKLHTTEVSGPRGEMTSAKWGMIPGDAIEAELRTFLDLPPEGDLAVIEMAQASGLQQLPSSLRDLWHTTTRGTGELMAEASRQGAGAILLGIGGSATNDLGLGALAALGLYFVGESGVRIDPPTPNNWENVTYVEGSIHPGLPPVRIACDVDNPLLGPRGAAAVYGPQKGLKPDDLRRMEAAMERMGKMLCQHCGVDAKAMAEPSSGAAGGIGFGLRVATGAHYVAGFELVHRWLRLEEQIAAADVIITGEGRFDASSLEGKGPGTLIREGLARGKRVCVLAGAVDEEAIGHASKDINRAILMPISDPITPLSEALQQGPKNLQRKAAVMAANWK